MSNMRETKLMTIIRSYVKQQGLRAVPNNEIFLAVNYYTGSIANPYTQTEIRSAINKLKQMNNI